MMIRLMFSISVSAIIPLSTAVSQSNNLNKMLRENGSLNLSILCVDRVSVELEGIAKNRVLT